LEADLAVADTAADMAVEDTVDIEVEALEPGWPVEVEVVQGPARTAHSLEHKMVFCNGYDYILLIPDSFSSPEVNNVIDIINFPITL
jgi:hypothetical protein